MLEYIQRRNRDFLATVNRLLRDPANSRFTLRQIVEKAASMPAPEYYITFSHIIDNMPGRESRRLPVTPRTRKAQMWSEILGRADAIVARTGCTRQNAVARVLEAGNASSFFISPSSAWVLYHGIMSGRLPYLQSNACHRPRR